MYLLHARRCHRVVIEYAIMAGFYKYADHNACEVCWFHNHPLISDPETAVAIIPRVHRLESWCDKAASVIIYPNSKVIVVNGTLYRCPRCDLPRRIFSDDAQWEQAIRETTDVFVSGDMDRFFSFSIERSDGTFHLPAVVLQVYTLFAANVRTLQRCFRRRLQKKRVLFEAFANMSHIRLGNNQLECTRRVCGSEDIMRMIFQDFP